MVKAMTLTTSRRKDEMKNYTYMLQSKVTGIVVSRHTSEALAIKALRKKTNSRDPLDLREYSEIVYNEMH